jgi:hypothetical protein
VGQLRACSPQRDASPQRRGGRCGSMRGSTTKASPPVSSVTVAAVGPRVWDAGRKTPKAGQPGDASAGRAENRASGADLTKPAFAGVGRPLGADQGRRSGSPLRGWRIPANADGTACGAFFDLTRLRQRLRRAGAARWPHRVAALTCLRRADPRSPTSLAHAFGGDLSVARRDAGSPLRKRRKTACRRPHRRRRKYRPKRVRYLAIQAIPYRPSHHPTRSRYRKARAGRSFFRA